MKVKRGEIFLVNFEPVKGSEQGVVRPAIVLQNNIYNEHSPATTVALITSRIFSKKFPTNVFISKKDSKLKVDSTILLNQIRTIDKSRIIKRLSKLDPYKMFQVDLATKISLGLEK